jgi:hypothetical protein
LIEGENVLLNVPNNFERTKRTRCCLGAVTAGGKARKKSSGWLLLAIAEPLANKMGGFSLVHRKASKRLDELCFLINWTARANRFKTAVGLAPAVRRFFFSSDSVRDRRAVSSGSHRRFG